MINFHKHLNCYKWICLQCLTIDRNNNSHGDDARGNKKETQRKIHHYKENLDKYLPCSKIQFCVANSIHFRWDIKFLQNRNWGAQWILRYICLRKQKSIPRHNKELKSTHNSRYSRNNEKFQECQLPSGKLMMGHSSRISSPWNSNSF